MSKPSGSAEQQYHFARLSSPDASVEQKILAAKAYRWGPAKESELDHIHALYLAENDPYLQHSLLRLLALRAIHRKEIQQLLASVCDPVRDESGQSVPVVAYALFEKSLETPTDESLVKAMQGLLPSLASKSREAVAGVLCAFGIWIEGYQKKKEQNDIGEQLIADFTNGAAGQMLDTVARQNPDGWIRWKASSLLSMLAKEVPKEWRAGIERAKMHNDVTEEEAFADLVESLNNINNRIPYKSALSREEQGRFIDEMRQSPKPEQLLEQYYEAGTKIILIQPGGAQGDAFDRLAKEICSLRESGLLTHFAMSYCGEDERLFHRFLDGELSRDLKPLIEDIQPDVLYTSITDPTDALLNYRDALRKIRDAGVNILLYRHNRSIDSDGENAFDHQLRTLLTPIRTGGRLLVYTDGNFCFNASKKYLTDSHGEMHVSIVPALQRELGNHSDSVMSVYQATENGLSAGTMMMKTHNLELVFNKYSPSKDIALGLQSSVLKPIRFRSDINESLGDAFDTIFIRTDEDNEDRLQDERPTVRHPRNLTPLQPA